MLCLSSNIANIILSLTACCSLSTDGMMLLYCVLAKINKTITESMKTEDTMVKEQSFLVGYIFSAATGTLFSAQAL